MINISCGTKFHAFALAEQFEKRRCLNTLYTVYHQKKDRILGRFNSRIDRELIDPHHIKTYPFLAPLFRLRKDPFVNNSYFDKLVSIDLKKKTNYKVFIGWSGMSLKSIQSAKSNHKIAVLERGSSHISHQYALLKEEYDLYGKTFKEDRRVEECELSEYELADYITVPSQFAAQSFLNRGYDASKIFVNNLGVSSLFKKSNQKYPKFVISYVGILSIQKGLIHLFKAIHMLRWPENQYEVWFMGGISEEIGEILPRYARSNWKFFGHVNHNDLSDRLSKCSVLVQPSIQEGLSMVLAQAMSCGVLPIATTNTGGEDIITDGQTGFIVPIRSPQKISEKLNILFEDRSLLYSMQENTSSFAGKFGTWDNYGDRYMEFVSSIITR